MAADPRGGRHPVAISLSGSGQARSIIVGVDAGAIVVGINARAGAAAIDAAAANIFIGVKAGARHGDAAGYGVDFFDGQCRYLVIMFHDFPLMPASGAGGRIYA